MEPSVVKLLNALYDLGTQDLYTDAEEYENRVGAMQELCAMAGAAAREGCVPVAQLDFAILNAIDSPEPDDYELDDYDGG